MNRRLAVVIMSLAVCAASQALAQYAPGHADTDTVDPGGHIPQLGNSEELPQEPEAKAEGLRLAGKCNEAIPIFRRLAARAGFEIAEFNLGLCLFDVSKAEPDPQRAAGLRREAADDVIKAANTGLANAQLKLVSMYLDGTGVVSDPVEAGKWALIYHSNGSRFVISLPDISPEMQARLDSALSTTGWSQAQSRADAWSPITQDWDGPK